MAWSVVGLFGLALLPMVIPGTLMEMQAADHKVLRCRIAGITSLKVDITREFDYGPAGSSIAANPPTKVVLAWRQGRRR